MAHFEETSIGFKTIFQKTFNDSNSEAKRLATEVKSNDLSEKYTWLGNFPNMKEWIGERDVKALTDFGYALENKLFEASVTVPNIHIEYDKAFINIILIKMFCQEINRLLASNTFLCYRITYYDTIIQTICPTETLSKN